MKMIIFDGSTTHLGNILKDYCDNSSNPEEPIIKCCISAPYKHQQNLSESHIHQEKNAMRTALAYNMASPFLWYKALRYQTKTINLQIVPGTKVTRQEAMTGIKPDITHYVPFYATGYSLVHKEERNNTLTYKAREVKMIGYADDLDEQTFPYQALHDDDDVEDYSPPQEGPRTRAFYEPNYWYAEMARANMLKASIFNDTTQSSINPHHHTQPQSDSSSDRYINPPGFSYKHKRGR